MIYFQMSQNYFCCCIPLPTPCTTHKATKSFSEWITFALVVERDWSSEDGKSSDSYVLLLKICMLTWQKLLHMSILFIRLMRKKEEIHVIREAKYFFSKEYLSWVLQANVLYNKCAVWVFVSSGFVAEYARQRYIRLLWRYERWIFEVMAHHSSIFHTILTQGFI